MPGAVVLQVVDAPAIALLLASAPVAGKGYTVGGAAQVTVTCLDANGNPYTPGPVGCVVTDPTGKVTVPTVTGPTGVASNVYTTQIPLTVAGAYTYKISASGGVSSLQGAANGFLQVDP